eukprot:358866-Chlamydomonas_euryale.AAC.6
MDPFLCPCPLRLQEDFDAAAAAAKELPGSIANDDKLALYGLFKQATVGDVNTGARALDRCWSWRGREGGKICPGSN